MKILWICGSRILGGAERVTLQLAGLLRARTHAVEVLCPRTSALHPALKAGRFTAYPAPIGGALNVRAVAAIRRALAAVSPDIAWVTTSDEWVWSCLATGRGASTRLVLVRHMVLPLAARIRWLAAHRADAVVAVSHAVRQSLLGRFGVPPERIHVIYNPVRFAPRPAVPRPEERMRAREALGLPTAGRWVGFFGGLHRAKGVKDVFSAVARANVELGPTNLLICGRPQRGRDGGAITRLAHECRLQGRVAYLGETDRVESALTAADVLVMATHRSLGEALPATLLEAMACGTPVLGYATGGILEIIGDDGHYGRLAQADDVADLGRVLIEVLADPAGAQRMAHDALARVRDLFDPQRAADQYERLFTALRSPP
jgi:glycosyltransferase involved in cell wall biosynthesis